MRTGLNIDSLTKQIGNSQDNSGDLLATLGQRVQLALQQKNSPNAVNEITTPQDVTKAVATLAQNSGQPLPAGTNYNMMI